MKINEVSNLNLNEFNPFSKRSRRLRKANIAGKKDLIATTDKLEDQFASYLGTKGMSMKQASYNDIKDFLTKKKVDISDIDTNVPFNSKRIREIFTAKAKQAMAGQTKTAAPTEPNNKTAPVSSQYAQTKDIALKLNAKEKRRLIQQLEKSIKSKSTVVDKNFDKSQKLSKFGKVGK